MAGNYDAAPAARVSSHLGWVLALVAGYVDSLGFVALFGLFTAHVTGNFVLIGKELSGPGPGEGVWLKLLAFPAFVLAVVLSRLIALAAQGRGKSAVQRLFVSQIVLLAGFMAAGLASQGARSADPGSTALPVLLAGLLGAMAMGVQNAQGRLELAALVPTTVMTGNVTQLVIDLVDLLVLPKAAADLVAGAAASVPVSARAAARARVKRMLPAVLGFGAGAICGAFAYHAWSYWALLLPLALLVWAALISGSHHVR